VKPRAAVIAPPVTAIRVSEIPLALALRSCSASAGERRLALGPAGGIRLADPDYFFVHSRRFTVGPTGRTAMTAGNTMFIKEIPVQPARRFVSIVIV